MCAPWTVLTQQGYCTAHRAVHVCAGQWTDNKDLVVDPAKAGNVLRFINDYMGFGEDVVNNVTWVEVFDLGTLRPHIFIFTVANIRAGEEILLDYGNVRSCSGFVLFWCG